MKRIIRMLIKAGVPVLAAVMAVLLLGAQVVYALEDYRAIGLYYNYTYVPITKPTAALVISANGNSASDGGSITVNSGQKIYLNTGGSRPGSATAIAEYDFQYSNPIGGYFQGSSVPAEITMTSPGTWVFYLCVRGNIPPDWIYGYYDDWSDNGSHSVIGEKNHEPMYWYFVEVIVNVLSAVPDFFIYRSSANVTGGTINADSMPVTVDMVDNSRNVSSYEWFIKTPGHADYVFFSSAKNPQAQIYTPGLENFKLRINGSYEIIKQVYVNDKKKPVAIVTAPLKAETNELFNVSGRNSYSLNSGGYIVSYQWNAGIAQGSLSPSSGLGSICYKSAGRYSIRLSVTDNYGMTSTESVFFVDVANKPPVQSIFPPIADFSLAKTEVGTSETLAITDSSRTSGSLEIITAREWAVERAGAVVYTGSVPKTTYSDTGSYTIFLRVKSSNGLWSASADRSLWTRKNFTVILIDKLPPDLSITPLNTQWTNKDVKFQINATDSGSAVKSVRYAITRYTNISDDPGPCQYFNFTEPAVSGTITAEGVWYVFAEATDIKLNVSPFKKGGPYMLDKTPPTLGAATVSGTGTASVAVNLSAADTGGSGVNYINASWSTLTARPLNWQRYDAASAQTSISQIGTFYLHAETFDKAGNSKYLCFGPYTVQGDVPKVENVTIEGAWNYWNCLPDASGRPTANEPHRFMSLETVKININTSGYVDKVVIRFSPELEAMTYADEFGNIYRYNEDFFGYEINFPEDSTCLTNSASNTSRVYWEYALPLADSTKGFETGARLRPAYSMQVTAYKGAKSNTFVINDIEVTGNVLDHIIIQPK